MSRSEIEQRRYNLVEQQIRPWDVLDPRVLDIVGSIDRAAYLDEPLRPYSMVDTELPLADGGVSLTPKMEARLLQTLELTGSETLLELGTGNGSLTACLAALCRHVTTITPSGQRADLVRERLRQQHVVNVTVQVADPLNNDQLPSGPFDAILVAGAVDQLPTHLLERLRGGGRLLAMIGDDRIQRATLYRHTGNGQWASASHFDGRIASLSARSTPTFQF